MPSQPITSSPSPLSIAFIVRDPLPPIRADVDTLFGTEMPRYGVHTELVGQGGSEGDASAWPAGGMHVVGSLRSPLAAFCSPLWDLVGLWRALGKGKRPDCVQVRDKIASGLLGRIAAALLRVPFVYWMSFPIVEGYAVRRDDIAHHQRGIKGRLKWAAHALRAWASRVTIYRLVLPGARHIFVQSDAMADWLASKGFSRERMTAVPMGVDAALFDRATVEPVQDARLDSRRVVLYLGRIAQSRKSDFLLDVTEELRKACPDVLLVIAGDAPSNDEMNWMRREIAARKLEQHVLLTGWLPRKTALGYAVRSEVGLAAVPRGVLGDTMSPTKVVEYLALGIPAVANDIPDQQLVIEQSGAGLCVPMEAQAFAAATLELLNDPERARQFGMRGPAYVKSHRTYDILGRNVARTYKKVLME
ncbi:glycosyltransferase [Massilia norwichensis]|uniref:Glycosyltransferase n=1 Tax=Massilia norwichensis TaxID=1442366 RepID=A0ABT2A581_9BURK|nr:glycosyltransferase [Massilia norwichensis]MCS0589351.1 glycosyltransferase [Massilia norwichensis]